MFIRPPTHGIPDSPLAITPCRAFSVLTLSTGESHRCATASEAFAMKRAVSVCGLAYRDRRRSPMARRKDPGLSDALLDQLLWAPIRRPLLTPEACLTG